MRRTAYQTLGAVLLVTALCAPAAAPARAAHAAAVGSAKVVVIVGPTGSSTDDYIADASAAATAARAWTANVVELYSPDATWDRVSAALQGASIVVYMGHGNGFPNPRAKALDGATMDGMGLNPPGGSKDSPTRYYGEDILASAVRLAPSAVVILGHLCYAGGSSEPGDPDPSEAVARQRADNFAAGWIRAGAGAVIADAWYGSTASVINGLFSAATTVDDLWRTLPGANAAEEVAPSVRSPGATLRLDPAGTKYWRSVTSMPGLTAADVVGGLAGDTASAPATLQVPGAAEVGAGGAPLYATVQAATEQAPVTLPPGTRLRVVRSAGTPKSGPLQGRPVVEVRTLDGATTGIVPTDALVPRDSRAPVASLLDGVVPGISPNGDGVRDTLALSGRFSEAATWAATITGRDGQAVLRTGGSGDAFAVTWDGTSGGTPVADGPYDLEVTATDEWGNAATPVAFTLLVDRTAPLLTATFPATPTVLSPDGDGVADTMRTAYRATEAGTLTVNVRDAAGAIVDTSEVSNPAGASAVIWDGRGPNGAPIPDGAYTYEIVPSDAAGNIGPAVVRRVIVSTTLGWVRTSASVIDPATPSATVRTAGLTFTLARPATVTWSMADARGRSIRFFAKGQPMQAGPQSATWDGLDDAGKPVPAGTYTMVVRAEDGLTHAVGRTTVGVGPFRVVVSPAAPVRGKVATFTVSTALGLSGRPTLRVALPGGSPIGVVLTQVDPVTWVGKLRLRAGGAAGTASLVVTGTDAAGTETASAFRIAVR